MTNQVLLTRFRLDNSQAITQARQFEAAMKKQNTSVQQAANLNRGFGRSSTIAAQQFSDFVIQVDQGGNVFRAFGQQMNQVAFFMRGPWGIALQFASLGILAFGDSILRAVTDSKDLSKESEDLASTLRRLGNEYASLTGKISEAEGETRGFLQAQRALNNIEYQDQLETLRELFEVSAAAGRVGGSAQVLFGQASANLRDNLKISAELARELVDNAQDFNRAFDADNANAMLDAIIGMRNEVIAFAEANSLSADEIKNLTDILFAAEESLRERAESIGDAFSKNVVQGINDAKDTMTGFLDQLEQGARYAYQIALGAAGRIRQEQLDAFGGEGDPYYSVPTTFTPEGFGKGSGSGGGGGPSQVDRMREDIEALLPQVQNAIDSYQSWTDLMIGDFKKGFVDVTESGVGAFVDAIAEADFSFQEFAKNFLRSISKMILQQSLLNILTMAFPGAGFGGTAPPLGIVPHAKGGVIGGPTMFAMGGSGKLGIAGEAGPEAVVPLSRDSSGNLGVGAIAPNITIVNNTGAEVETRQVSDEETQIIIGRAVQATTQEISRQLALGNGNVARSLEQGYTSRRRVT